MNKDTKTRIKTVYASLKRLAQINIPDGTLSYRCNICGQACRSRIEDLDRERPSCLCGSTVRSRAIVHLLSMELFGESLVLRDFPERSEIVGWGLSDTGYSDLLPQKLNYTNTFFHKEPVLDIMAPLNPSSMGKLDFLISSDVFEHIPLPVSQGFKNARALIKPTGFFILTVPYTLENETMEHFPDLHEYIIDKQNDLYVLKNLTKDGKSQVFTDLIFHGGPGSTLEMRVFSQTGVLSEIQKAGFMKVEIHSEPFWKFGIYWSNPCSLPMVARPA